MRASKLGFVIAVLSVAASGCGTTGQQSGASMTASVTASSPVDAAAWSYEGATGPEHWGDIAPGCQTTADSAESPIDIETATLAAGPGAAVALRYTPTAFEVENNGHTIEAVPHDTRQNSITIDGVPYYLRQFHFHAVSEHQLNGANTDMELHLVHRSDAGELGVLGVLLDSGTANEPLDELFTSIPAAENHAPVELRHEIDVAALIPTDPTLAQYPGSLTTPPCTEGVRWNVFLTPQTLSAAQIAAYTAVYPNSSRPVQPLNGRTVVQTDAGS